MSKGSLEKSSADNKLEQIAPATPGHVRTLLLRGQQPILLLGAGASVTSGILSAAPTVEKAARWAWCEEQGRSFDDFRIQRSDYYPWLQQQAWFREDISLADQYPLAIRNLLGVRRSRREFFEKLVSPGIPPKDGYRSLVKILNEGWINTVLTTNFDHCIEEAKTLENKPHMLVSIKTPADYIRFSVSPSAPQLIFLHGSIEHYSDKNAAEEIQTLDSDLTARLAPMLRDHPIIVVGYRGTENSVMNDLFLSQLTATNSFAQGVYWCVRESNPQEALAPMVLDLATRIGPNFRLVTIRGFDELFQHDLWNRLKAEGALPIRRQGGFRPFEAPVDMRVVSGSAFAELDTKTLQARLSQYAQRLGLSAVSPVDETWQQQEALQRNLLIDEDSELKPTLAGWLLFAREPQARAPNAKVNFRAIGPLSWIKKCFGDDVADQEPDTNGEIAVEQEITGNLWAQLDALSELLSLINQGFRLKEEISRTVYPFAPVAVKEVLVNALVHRDYERAEAVSVVITPYMLEVKSPGGLIAEVVAQTEGKTLESVVSGGSRGIKGYRNPVISDLFYGGGQMDRSGSGLADIWIQSKNNNAEARFGPDTSNENFIVTIFARPESVDEVTNTAVPLVVETTRFAANILPIHEMPQRVWHAGTSASSAGRLVQDADGLAVPRGYVQDGRFFTLFDLEALAERNVTPFEAGDIETLSIPELLALPNGENILLKLLHEMIFEHLRARGLVIDFKRRRAHFPKGEDLEVKITYRGRVKRATRTVVKARTRRNSDDVIYFEHKAMTFSVVRFGEDWGIIVTPGYLFTKDGDRKPIGRDKTNILSTKRAARDFNPSVHHDVTFWASIFGGDTDGVFALKCQDGNDLAEYAPTVLVSRSLPTVVFNSAGAEADEAESDGDTDFDDLEEELEALAEEEDQKVGDEQ